MSFRSNGMSPEYRSASELVLIKIGGSVITDKSSRDVFLEENLRSLAKVMRSYPGRIILVHGTGSFGKPLAEDFDFPLGRIDRDRVCIFSRVQRTLRVLHGRVMEVLLDAGLGVVSLHPGSFVMFRDGEISSFDDRVLKDHLANGFFPVLHGDVVVDEGRGFRVCSSDRLVLELSRRYAVGKVIWITDVDGVYSSDPRGPGPHVLLNTVDETAFLGLPSSRNDARDVSGGMHEKARTALDVAALVPDCRVINGLRPDNLRAVLDGAATIGTRIVRTRSLSGEGRIRRSARDGKRGKNDEGLTRTAV